MHGEGITKNNSWQCYWYINFPKLAESVLVYCLQDVLLTEAFIIPSNVGSLDLPNQPDLKHRFSRNLELMASLV